MKNQVRLGIDFGNTIVKFVRKDDESESEWVEIDGATETIRRLVERYGAEHIFIITKAVRRDQTKTLLWLKQHWEIDRPSARKRCYRATGLKVDNIYFCAHRAEKAPIAARLRLTHYIDDRPRVLSCLTTVRNKILFNSTAEDLSAWQDQIVGRVSIVSDWRGVAQILLPELSQPRTHLKGVSPHY